MFDIAICIMMWNNSYSPFIQTNTLIQTRTRLYTHVYPYMYTFSSTQLLHIHSHKHLQSCMHTYIYTYMHTYIIIHLHTHLYIYTHSQVLKYSFLYSESHLIWSQRLNEWRQMSDTYVLCICYEHKRDVIFF